MARRAASALLALVLAADVATGARINHERMRQEMATLSKMQSLEQYRAQHAHVLAVESEFFDFGKIVNWAKNEAKEIMETVQEETMETFEEVKGVVANRIGNFKAVLGETREKCGTVIHNLKGELMEGLKGIGEVAKEELPQYYKHLDGLKVRIGEARDALTAQLLAGSVSGASDVLQEHLAVIWKEAQDTASGPLKDQFLASADRLKEELGKLLTDVSDSGKEQFTGVFTDTMDDAEDLVHQLMGEIQDQIEEGGRELASELGKDLQATGEEFVAGIKNGDFKPDEAGPAPAALLEMTRGRVQWGFLKEQLDKLRQSARDLADAAVQAASAQAEKIIDSATVLAEQAGDAIMGAVDEHVVPKLKELKAQGLATLQKTLSNLRIEAFKSADVAVAKLTEMHEVAGTIAQDMLKKHGPAVEQWAKDLEARILDMANTKTDIDAARDALEDALDEKLTMAAGKLQEQLRQAQGEVELKLRQQLADLEVEIFEKRTVAYKAKKKAAEALEALAAKATDAVGKLKAQMQRSGDDQQVALAEQLTIMEDYAKKLWNLARDYGSQAQAALDEAQSAASAPAPAEAADA